MKKIVILCTLLTLTACYSGNLTQLETGEHHGPIQADVTFCANNPDECKVPMTARAYASIQTAHAGLRYQFQYEWDKPGTEGDVWEITNKGDCEDYALSLQKLLRSQWPRHAQAFNIAIVTTETGQGHAVLTVDALEGTLVCDLRYPECADHAFFPYKYLVKQSGLTWWKAS